MLQRAHNRAYRKHKMRILVVSPFLYSAYSADGGGAFSYRQLKSLAEAGYIIDFLSFSHVGENNNQQHTLALQEFCASVQSLPLSITRLKKWRAKYRLLCANEPIDANLYADDAFSRCLLTRVAAVSPDLIILQFPQMAQYVLPLSQGYPAIPVVLDTQDAFSVSAYREMNTQTDMLARYIKRQTWLAWIAYEAKYYALASLTMTLTQQDAIGLRIFSPALRVEANPAGVACADFLPLPPASQSCVAFVGSFGHRPNVEAVEWLANTIMPLVWKVMPEVRLRVIGRQPPAFLSTRQDARIQCLGFVEDLVSTLRAMSVVAIPLRSGGGVKIKTLDAMAAACAVVSTAIGVEELGVEAEVQYLAAESAQLFANQLLRVLQDHRLRQKLGQAAQQHIVKNFSRQANLMRFKRIFSQAMQQHKPLADWRHSA